MLNKLKEKLGKGEVAWGAWLNIHHEGSVAAMARSGIDWILIDGEHLSINPETMARLIQAIGNKGATSLIRVASDDVWLIKQALDTGAYGIVVPWVNTAEETAKIVDSTRYMPEGIRGSYPLNAAKVWGISPREYSDKANDNVFVCVQIETKEAVENIDEIVKVPGLDAVMIGPGDLSGSLGVRGEYWHPKIMESIDVVLKACKNSPVAPGIAFSKDLDHARQMVKDGFTFIGAGTDEGFMVQGVKNQLDALNK